MVREVFEIDKNKIYGRLYDLKAYKSVEFNIPPMKFSTHDMVNWIMEFRQKRIKSRMYLHFHNQQDFGFRIILPSGVYSSVNDIINAIPTTVNFKSSFYSTKSNFNNQQDFEDVLKSEQKRILKEIGDYRGSEKQLPNNVVSFLDYLKEPPPIRTTEQFEISLKLA